MPFLFSNHHISFSLPQKPNIEAWLNHVVTSMGFKAGEIHYLFCSDAYILEINTQYLHHNYYTDVITFNYSTSRLISGDIVISIDTVSSNAALYDVAISTELRRVMVHGLLHLLGFGDDTPEEQTIMRGMEDTMLSLYETKFR